MSRWGLAVLVGAVSVSIPAVGRSDNKPNPYEAQVRKGRDYLFSQLDKENRIGYLALGTLALQKTSPDNHSPGEKDPRIESYIKRIRAEADRGAPAFQGSEAHYAMGLVIMSLIADGIENHEKPVRALVRTLIERQLENGGWAYVNDTAADTSQTQYILLALWDAAQAGIEVPVKVWDLALLFHCRSQDSTSDIGPGGFGYHPDVPKTDTRKEQGEVTTMGVAGLGSMLICQSQIPMLRKKAAKHMDISELVRPARDDDGDNSYKPQVSYEMAQRAINDSETWVMRANPYSGVHAAGSKIYYYLYGLERCAALRRGGAFSKIDWHGVGAGHIIGNQQADGSFKSGEYGGIPDTSFAIMFLGKAMARKILKLDFEQLQKSVLVGGRGIPSADGSAIGALQRQSEKYRVQVTSSIDDLVKAFDDPNALNADDNTSAQIMSPEEVKALIQKLGGDTRKLRQWAYDQRPEAKKTALSALYRTRDSRIVPILIDALKDQDESVYTVARDGIRYMSRDVEAFGLPPGDKRDPTKLKDGVAKCEEWYAMLKVQPSAQQEFSPPAAP